MPSMLGNAKCVGSNGRDRTVKEQSLFFEERHRGGRQGRRAEVGQARTDGFDFTHANLPGNSLFQTLDESDVIQLTRDEFFEGLLKLRDDERDRVGHELHDSAGQLLLYLQLSVARLKLIEAAEQHSELIEEIQSTARQISAEIRSLAFINHPVRMPTDGLSSAVESLLAGFGKRTGYDVSFSTDGDVTKADATTSLALLRVAQEALVNIHRHARASTVSMSLSAGDDLVELAIRDDGIGMPTDDEMSHKGGVGVEGMRFRVEQLGGEFRIGNIAHGTEIVAQMPLRAPARG